MTDPQAHQLRTIARLQRTIETMQAERDVVEAEGEVFRRRAVWRERQRDHLQVELRNAADDLSELRAQLIAVEPVVEAAVWYHQIEFMGERAEGRDPGLVRTEFDLQVRAYRNRVGLDGGPEVPF